MGKISEPLGDLRTDKVNELIVESQGSLQRDTPALVTHYCNIILQLLPNYMDTMEVDASNRPEPIWGA